MTHKNPDVRELLREIRSMTTAEAEEMYDFEILANGQIHDNLDKVRYRSIEEWAEAQFGPKNESLGHGHEWDE